MQYYTQQLNIDLEEIMRGTKKFVHEIENIADSLNSERIVELQNRMKALARS